MIHYRIILKEGGSFVVFLKNQRCVLIDTYLVIFQFQLFNWRPPLISTFRAKSNLHSINARRLQSNGLFQQHILSEPRVFLFVGTFLANIPEHIGTGISWPPLNAQKTIDSSSHLGTVSEKSRNLSTEKYSKGGPF